MQHLLPVHFSELLYFLKKRQQSFVVNVSITTSQQSFFTETVLGLLNSEKKYCERYSEWKLSCVNSVLTLALEIAFLYNYLVRSQTLKPFHLKIHSEDLCNSICGYFLVLGAAKRVLRVLKTTTTRAKVLCYRAKVLVVKVNTSRSLKQKL